MKKRKFFLCSSFIKVVNKLLSILWLNKQYKTHWGYLDEKTG
jgi:hypothetical protein